MRSILEKITPAVLLAAFCALAAPVASAQPSQSPVIHHDLVVTLDPASHRLKVRDRIRIPGAFVTAPFTISLNADLNLQAVPGGLTLTPIRTRVPGTDSGMDRDDHDPASRVPVTIYRVEGAIPGRELTGEINYEGTINYVVKESGGEYARAFAQSPGLIEARGVYLAGSTHWVPRVGDALMTYTLAVELPADWKSVSQGERTSSAAPERWAVATPTEEVHLIAAPFTEYSRDAGAVKALAFLRKPDQAMADRYLDATAQYLDMYRGLLGSLSLFQVRAGGEFLGDRLRHAVVHPARRAGHPVSVHPAFVLPARAAAQLVGQRRLRRFRRAATGARA